MLAGTGQNYLGPRSTVAGPFAICPITLNSSATLDLLAEKPQPKFRSMTLQVMILAEPKLRSARFNLIINEAIDETGKNLIAAETTTTVQPLGGTGQMASIPLRLQGGEVGKKLTKVSGTLRARVAARSRTIELDDALKAQDKDFDFSGRSMKITVTPKDDLYEVKLKLPNRGNTQDETGISLHRDLTMVDADGNALHRRSFQQAHVPPGSWEYTFTFAREGAGFGKQARKTGEPAKLIWNLAVEPKELDVPFELTDIPLVSQ
jgi:hypothetical protein